MDRQRYVHENWERGLAVSFLGINKSVIVFSAMDNARGREETRETIKEKEATMTKSEEMNKRGIYCAKKRRRDGDKLRGKKEERRFKRDIV
jgi:hypothetical protein